MADKIDNTTFEDQLQEKQNDDIEMETVIEENDNSEDELNLKKENEKLKDQLMRVAAEKENIQKRLEKEKIDLGKYVITNFARELLHVADTLSLALKDIKNKSDTEKGGLKSVIEGIELTESNLMKIFEKFKIKKIDPKGVPFDHNYHQAMIQVESPDHQPGDIVNVFQQGYIIEDRLLRPAMVSVAKASETSQE